MAMNVNYVFRETFTNLTRNITLTLASILTVTVSLMILGSTVIIQRGAANMTAEWDGGIEFMVYVNADATDAEIEAIAEDLENHRLVERAVYVDREETYREFIRLFEDSPAMRDSVTKDKLPTKFKVVPKSKDEATVRALVEHYQNDVPNVYSVRAALDVIKQLKALTGFLNRALWVVSAALIVASVLLILNTVRTAMFARRREIEVMKLVGATNWFIRVPFMVEGLIQGVIGGVLACAAVFGVRTLLEDNLGRSDHQITLLQGFEVTRGDLMLACGLVIGIAVVISTVSAALATRRFLAV